MLLLDTAQFRGPEISDTPYFQWLNGHAYAHFLLLLLEVCWNRSQGIPTQWSFPAIPDTSYFQHWDESVYAHVARWCEVVRHLPETSNNWMETVMHVSFNYWKSEISPDISDTTYFPVKCYVLNLLLTGHTCICILVWARGYPSSSECEQSGVTQSDFETETFAWRVSTNVLEMFSWKVSTQLRWLRWLQWLRPRSDFEPSFLEPSDPEVTSSRVFSSQMIYNMRMLSRAMLYARHSITEWNVWTHIRSVIEGIRRLRSLGRGSIHLARTHTHTHIYMYIRCQ